MVAMLKLTYWLHSSYAKAVCEILCLCMCCILNCCTCLSNTLLPLLNPRSLQKTTMSCIIAQLSWQSWRMVWHTQSHITHTRQSFIYPCVSACTRINHDWDPSICHHLRPTGRTCQNIRHSIYLSTDTCISSHLSWSQNLQSELCMFCPYFTVRT